MITLAKFTDNRIEVMDDQNSGWREPDSNEWVDIGGGNSLQINGDSYFSGLFQGFAAGTLCALFAIGIVAVIVAP